MTAALHPSGRRTAATWVGATGAFLLLAATGVFVAVRWDNLPDTAKLALVGGLTGAFLLVGRALRPTLPATGEVLFHLGAFLVPIDLAAACLRLDVGWRATVLAEGVVGLAVFTALAGTTGSVVLNRAAIGAGMVLAAGLAAVSPVPAPLVLAAAAVLVDAAAGHTRTTLRRVSLVWAGVAGLAPVLAAVATNLLDGTGTRLGTGTLTELGLAGRTQLLVTAASGILAAAVLARHAYLRRDVRLAFLAAASVAIGVGTTGTAAHVSVPAWTVGLAGLFVLIEVVALMVWDDDFWGRPAAVLAEWAESLASLASAAAACALFFAPLLDGAEPMTGSVMLAAALVLMALGWLTADLRRLDPTRVSVGSGLLHGSGWIPATLGVAAVLPAAVMVGTAAAVPTGLALLLVSAALVAAGRPRAGMLVLASATWAALTLHAHPTLMPAVGLAGALAGTWSIRHSRNAHERAGLASYAALLAAGSGLAAEGWLGASAAVCLSAAACWVTAAVVDWVGGRGDAGRVLLLLPIVAATSLTPTEAVAPLALVTALFVLDALRLGRPVVAFGAAAVVQPLVVVLAQMNGLSLGWAGFALCVCAVVWAGVASVVEATWRAPFLAAAGSGLVLGLVLASNAPEPFADALLVAGGLGIAVGVLVRRTVLAHAGGIVTTAGLVSHLLMADVVTSEAYVAPVAVQLLAAGWQARRRKPGLGGPNAVPASSWIAYTPAVVLLGGAALLERMGDGAGWHAVLAGAVGVAAVAVGGWRRLAGPMLAGTALLAVLSVRESMSTLAGVPTWGWLALGGTVLLATAVVMERTDASPVEAGRRVVDVLAERFD